MLSTLRTHDNKRWNMCLSCGTTCINYQMIQDILVFQIRSYTQDLPRRDLIRFRITGQKIKSRSGIKNSKRFVFILNDVGHCVSMKIVTDDKPIYTVPIFDISKHQESKIWVLKNESTQTTVKRQRAMKQVMYAMFQSTGIGTGIGSYYVDISKTCLPEFFQELNVIRWIKK